MEKRQKPETACTDCGAPGSNLTLTEDHGSCWRPGCKGSIQTAIGVPVAVHDGHSAQSFMRKGQGLQPV